MNGAGAPCPCWIAASRCCDETSVSVPLPCMETTHSGIDGSPEQPTHPLMCFWTTGSAVGRPVAVSGRPGLLSERFERQPVYGLHEFLSHRFELSYQGPGLFELVLGRRVFNFRRHATG